MKFLLIFKEFSISTKNLFLSAFFVMLIILLLPSREILSQDMLSAENDINIRKLKLKESVGFSESLTDTTIRSTGKINLKMKKDPWKAVLFSAVLPGSGQFYNQSYWKIPVILGLGGYFAYGWIDNNNQYLDYKQQYINSQTTSNPAGDPQLLNLRNFYQDQRDNFIIYSSILYLVNLIDAYVDAQLFDFDVSDNVNFGILQKEKLIKLSYGF